MKRKSLICPGRDKRILFTFLLFFLLSGAFAQNKIRGVVVESDTQEPVIGANIKVKNTSKGTVTDVDGNFEIDADKGTGLIVSYIGFLPREILIEGSSFLRIELDKNTGLLDEVMVIGYGQVKKSDATGSVLAIKPDQLNRGL